MSGCDPVQLFENIARVFQALHMGPVRAEDHPVGAQRPGGEPDVGRHPVVPSGLVAAIGDYLPAELKAVIGDD